MRISETRYISQNFNSDHFEAVPGRPAPEFQVKMVKFHMNYFFSYRKNLKIIFHIIYMEAAGG